MSKPSQPTKAVIYCRVSTKEQAEEGNSLVTQEKLCRDYAIKHGYDIAAAFIEYGESAKTADRKELKRMLEFCATKKNAVSAVIIYKIDRLSRNTDDYSQLRLLLKKYAVEIKSTSEHFEDNPAGRFMENIIANVAQFDNDVRAERCAGGMRDAMREGRYVWMAPTGYINLKVNGKSTIAQSEKALLVHNTFTLIAQGIFSVEKVRKEMSKVGLTNTLNRPIAKSYFYRMLRNELYAGWIIKFGERHRGTFEPIISDALFATVQAILDRKKKASFERITDHPDFPLRRFIRHPLGRLLTGCWSQGKKKKYPYYRFQSTTINIRKETLEDTFTIWLNQFGLDAEQFEPLFREVQDYITHNTANTAQRKIQLEEKLQAIKKKQQTIIAKNIDGVIPDALCKVQLADTESQLYSIEQEIATLSENKHSKEDILPFVRQAILSPGELWKKAPLEQQLRLQWFYFPEGITLEKTGSRTPKICSLFKVKALFQPSLSANVHLSNQKTNTPNTQISRTWKTLTIEDEFSILTKKEMVETILDEAKTLRAILNTDNSENGDIPKLAA